MPGLDLEAELAVLSLLANDSPIPKEQQLNKVRGGTPNSILLSSLLPPLPDLT